MRRLLVVETSSDTSGTVDTGARWRPDATVPLVPLLLWPTLLALPQKVNIEFIRAMQE